jgi:NAD(P)-dependent dehydrogenase (short-subunit alcohol dehydrogenase family)
VRRADAQVEKMMQHAAKTFGRVDGVVNCVGSVLLKPAHTTSDEEVCAPQHRRAQAQHPSAARPALPASSISSLPP